MSEVKVNKISPRTACGTVTLGDSGDTFTIPSGATITNAGTATGFGGTGVVSWETGSIKTTGFTAVTGTGYFCNTTGGGFTVTLPLSPSAGDVVGVADYAQTWDTGNLTLGRNSSNIAGVASDSVISTEGLAVTLVYVDGTKGWIVTDSGLQSDAPGPVYVTATGGTITTSGNFKVHTFTGPGTFAVSCAGNCAGSNTVDYMVVGGGGGGGTGEVCGDYEGAGGGAGGYRESPGAASGCYTVSPRGVAPAVALPVSATPYSIVVGSGGAGAPYPSSSGTSGVGSTGDLSSFSTISSAGGGGGGGRSTPSGTPYGGQPGGSGGGAGQSDTCAQSRYFGTGNTPTQTPAQGTNGGRSAYPQTSPTASGGGGGGGAAVVGGDGPGGTNGGNGGCGATSSINATPTARAGGGGGAGVCNSTGLAGPGGGGRGRSVSNAVGAGSVNTGGGGGGGSGCGSSGGNGGSGIVIIRYKFQ